MRFFQDFFLVSWDNGITMIAVFAGVCVILITAVLLLMQGGKKS